uniref:Uncharacterized protein n=1 Tax=Eutreptiella gymnastica TaxID=73025 RepID=A0A7S4LHL6_9EUGL
MLLLCSTGLNVIASLAGIAGIRILPARHGYQILAIRFQGRADWDIPHGPHCCAAVWETPSWCLCVCRGRGAGTVCPALSQPNPTPLVRVCVGVCACVRVCVCVCV